ncbi:helitron_like_N domain-containing protein [Nephila pilipes]|uniref:Helitron_like_N domain-containing protein n=1 Tax=Nephila pilipes TaxID=299642 RepID=A0A8X6PU29_NEPPI|nr:helitron_like_N domain-containing protein [Nephila pilipes]
MYVKIESERLRFIRYNQAIGRIYPLTRYDRKNISLRDAIVGNIDGNLNPNDIGSTFILPSSYIGSPRNMQEYIQDAITYTRILEIFGYEEESLRPICFDLLWLQYPRDHGHGLATGFSSSQMTNNLSSAHCE